jgi:hypothetical protein
MGAEVQVVLLAGQVLPALMLPVQLRLFSAPPALGRHCLASSLFLCHDSSYAYAPWFWCGVSNVFSRFHHQVMAFFSGKAYG